MGCCGGSNKRIKEWGNTDQKSCPGNKLSFRTIALIILLLGLIVYKFFI